MAGRKVRKLRLRKTKYLSVAIGGELDIHKGKREKGISH